MSLLFNAKYTALELLLNYLTLTLQPFTLYYPDIFVITSSFSLSEVELFYHSVCKIAFSVLLCLLSSDSPLEYSLKKIYNERLQTYTALTITCIYLKDRKVE